MFACAKDDPSHSTTTIASAMNNRANRPLGPEVDDTSPAKFPNRLSMKGRFITLEPLANSHVDDLFAAIGGSESTYLWDYVPGEGPFSDKAGFDAYFERQRSSVARVFYAAIDNATLKAAGLACFLNINPTNRVVEVGHVVFSPSLQRSSAVTETMYLMARATFEESGYRRYEWKCDNLNETSKRAATRLGFTPEGLFRQHMIVKGRNRDTMWFSMLDSEWPVVKAGFERWLDPSNFDDAGKQKQRLEALRELEREAHE
ncbi:hypothetical protein FRB97_008350 [Tulasnella sp. 331]|nr:hypothetical protein FRB97_008350 [Tulasnella sp. 331]